MCALCPLRHSSRWLLIIVLQSACGDSGPSDVDLGDVRRVTAAVTVGLEPGDSSIARVLGWQTGVPGAEVQLRRGSESNVITVQTSADGSVTVPDLLPGSYTISITRRLSDAERTALSAVDPEVRVIAGARTAFVTEHNTAVSVTAAAARAGSLVISEFVHGRVSNGSVEYSWAGYVEVYNNADTVVYLDGKLLGAAWDFSNDYPNYPCSMFSDFRTDPVGVWSRFIYRFPGAGTEYPLQPGGKVVIATDAIDHTALAAGTQDLSAAEFEFVGGADVDNPDAVNMINVGPGGELSEGHGYRFFGTANIPYIAEPLDIASLPLEREPANQQEYVRIPGAALIDVAAFKLISTTPSQYSRCQFIIHPNWDRKDATIMHNYNTRPAHRKVLGTTAAGHPLLQRTRTSDRDFELRDPSPGRVP